MKNKVRQMIKDVIQENAVSFKENTAKELYCKVSEKLNEQYKAVSKNIFKSDKK
jgi:hypothetical protein